MYIFVLFLLAFVSRGVASGSYFCGNGYSSRREFKCLEGANCVDKENVCDGTKDCSDGSDEGSCSNNGNETRKLCILPAYPAHGTYEVLNEPRAKPSQTFEFFALRVSCERGYGMVERGYDDEYNSTFEVLCVNGVWSSPIPKCVRFCRLNPDPSIRYMCLGTICKNYVAPGTLVNPICNSPIYYSTESLLYMKCKSGSWDYVARCKADCGRLTPKGIQLVIGGTVAKRGELPWHTAIYRKTTIPFMQICGGSLVSNNFVISAAHCFWSDLRKLLPPADFAVAIGKLYRPWDDERDLDVQKSEVKEIRVPTLFQGAAANFQEDIAVLILTTPITYKIYVRPVCLNFDLVFDTIQLQHGNIGKVAGWGLTAANGAASQILQVVEIPFVNEKTCVNDLPPSFRAYITGDKFCAGYTNGTALCKGDSGGGIVFSEREQGVDRYYLRGIVSTAPNVEDQLCNDKSYTTFTKIRRHEDFIKSSLVDANLVKNCPPYMFQCNDETCQDEEADCSENR